MMKNAILVGLLVCAACGGGPELGRYKGDLIDLRSCSDGTANTTPFPGVLANVSASGASYMVAMGLCNIRAEFSNGVLVLSQTTCSNDPSLAPGSSYVIQSGTMAVANNALAVKLTAQEVTPPVTPGTTTLTCSINETGNLLFQQ